MMNTEKDRRKEKRFSYSANIEFTVLSTSMQDLRHQKIQTEGEIINASKSGIGIMTSLPLEPGHVLMWDDQHLKGKLHIALVKWVREENSSCRAGLTFI